VTDQPADSTPQRRPPASHPYLAEIVIDPADHYRFCQLADDRPEIRIIDQDLTRPDTWTMVVACASRETRRRLEEAWA
jgi:hypothetical protein